MGHPAICSIVAPISNAVSVSSNLVAQEMQRAFLLVVLLPQAAVGCAPCHSMILKVPQPPSNELQLAHGWAASLTSEHHGVGSGLRRWLQCNQWCVAFSVMKSRTLSGRREVPATDPCLRLQSTDFQRQAVPVAVAIPGVTMRGHGEVASKRASAPKDLQVV